MGAGRATRAMARGTHRHGGGGHGWIVCATASGLCAEGACLSQLGRSVGGSFVPSGRPYCEYSHVRLLRRIAYVLALLSSAVHTIVSNIEAAVCGGAHCRCCNSAGACRRATASHCLASSPSLAYINPPTSAAWRVTVLSCFSYLIYKKSPQITKFTKNTKYELRNLYIYMYITK